MRSLLHSSLLHSDAFTAQKLHRRMEAAIRTAAPYTYKGPTGQKYQYIPGCTFVTLESENQISSSSIQFIGDTCLATQNRGIELAAQVNPRAQPAQVGPQLVNMDQAFQLPKQDEALQMRQAIQLRTLASN